MKSLVLLVALLPLSGLAPALAQTCAFPVHRGSAAVSEAVLRIDDRTAADVIGSRPWSVVTLSAQWAGPQSMLMPVLENLSTLYGSDVVFAVADVDESPSLVEACDVRAVPTTLIFHHGRLRENVVGVVDGTLLGEELNRVRTAVADPLVPGNEEGSSWASAGVIALMLVGLGVLLVHLVRSVRTLQRQVDTLRRHVRLLDQAQQQPSMSTSTPPVGMPARRTQPRITRPLVAVRSLADDRPWGRL